MEELSVPIIPEDIALRAYTAALLPIKTENDAFFFFASMNLLNAYVKRAPKESDFWKRYKFKHHLVRGIEQIILQEISAVQIYLNPEVNYISVRNYQFSFHNIRFSNRLMRYAASDRNKPQTWRGARLQPLALDIFQEAENLFRGK